MRPEDPGVTTGRPALAASARRAIGSLDEVHDYYAHTKAVWRFLQNTVRRGERTLSVRNLETGHEVSGADLAERSQAYVTGYLAESTFQDFNAIFEHFLFEFLTIWLRAYPGRSRGRRWRLTWSLKCRTANRSSKRLSAANSMRSDTNESRSGSATSTMLRRWVLLPITR